VVSGIEREWCLKLKETEYQEIQNRLRNKLHDNSYTGNKREIYQNGIKSAMSIVKELYEKYQNSEEVTN